MIELNKGNYIGVVGYGYIDSITYMTLYHYDKPEFSNYLINCCVMYSYDDIISEFPQYEGYILYNLEHLLDQFGHIKLDLIKSILKWGIIWEYDIINYLLIKSIIDRFNLPNQIYFMPVRYFPYKEDYLEDGKFDFELMFYGSINERRLRYLKDILSYPNNYPALMLTGKTLGYLLPYFNKSKFILNIHQDSIFYQEQVRIFECILLNKTVISEPSLVNYYPNMIYELSIHDIEDIKLIRSLKLLYPRNRLKELTFKDEDFISFRDTILLNNKDILKLNNLEINFNKYEDYIWI